MQNVIGPPVQAEDFFGRQVETSALWSCISRSHVLLLAPRRVGKTSLLLHMANRPREGWNCVFVPVEDVQTEAGFISRLWERLRESLPAADAGRVSRMFQEVLARVQKVGPVELGSAAGKDQSWRDDAESLLEALAGLSGRTLVLIDEFPLFVEHLLEAPDGKRRARLFMDWFRFFRNHPRIGYEKVRYVVCGSGGLDTLVNRIQLSATINDMDTFQLGPLSRDLADELLVRLARGANLALTPELRRKMLTMVHWLIPYHLQLLFGELSDLALRPGKALSEDLVDEAYQSLLSSKSTKHFHHWEERLRAAFVIPEERTLALEILKAAGRDVQGVGDETIRSLRRRYAPSCDEHPLLMSLERDGYLVEQESRYLFVSPLLRDWWLRWIVRRRKSAQEADHAV